MTAHKQPGTQAVLKSHTEKIHVFVQFYYRELLVITRHTTGLTNHLQYTGRIEYLTFSLTDPSLSDRVGLLCWGSKPTGLVRLSPNRSNHLELCNCQDTSYIPSPHWPGIGQLTCLQYEHSVTNGQVAAPSTWVGCSKEINTSLWDNPTTRLHYASWFFEPDGNHYLYCYYALSGILQNRSL